MFSTRVARLSKGRILAFWNSLHHTKYPEAFVFEEPTVLVMRNKVSDDAKPEKHKEEVIYFTDTYGIPLMDKPVVVKHEQLTEEKTVITDTYGFPI